MPSNITVVPQKSLPQDPLNLNTVVIKPLQKIILDLKKQLPEVDNKKSKPAFQGDCTLDIEMSYSSAHAMYSFNSAIANSFSLLYSIFLEKYNENYFKPVTQQKIDKLEEIITYTTSCIKSDSPSTDNTDLATQIAVKIENDACDPAIRKHRDSIAPALVGIVGVIAGIILTATLFGALAWLSKDFRTSFNQTFFGTETQGLLRDMSKKLIENNKPDQQPLLPLNFL